MLEFVFHLLGLVLLPVIAFISFIRGKSIDDQPPSQTLNVEIPQENSAGLLSFLFQYEASGTKHYAKTPRDIDTSDEAAAKAIADSLVTQTLPTSDATSRRRSVRISQMKNDECQPPSVKSPTSAALSPDIIKRARSRASGTSKPLIPAKPSRKTLILDLDETLIHSLSKGGQISNGHMIEVKLGTHAILYYVYKRPHCDLFLEKVSQWYDVVIFTASVQEYADPVIDWLEQDRKFFKARYYRQHCTYRYGAYMKNLSIAEPDLSRAIIVDNSPLSYRMNEDNAVPIEGWISDPSDRDLLYLIPVLQNLHFVHDVRSLLSLRQPD